MSLDVCLITTSLLEMLQKLQVISFLSADVIGGGTYPRSSDDDKRPMNGGYIGLGQG